MTNREPVILWLGRDDVTLLNVGGKGANLGRLLQGDFPVPPGFVISTRAYRRFIDANRLSRTVVGLSQNTDLDDPLSFELVSKAIRERIESCPVPPEIAGPITDAYRQLAQGDEHFPVAVRSSATAEDLPDASFAGQQDTFLNVRGEEALLDAVKRCWSSLWTARAMAYRARQGIPPEVVSLAVVVQTMVPADAAGVLFTVNPVSGARDEMVINATWGLGESLVSGRVNPDTIIVEKTTGAVKEMLVGDKNVMTVPAAGGTEEAPVSPAQQAQPVLEEDTILRLVELGRGIEEQFGAPQDVEWAAAAGQTYILQARPVTTALAPADSIPGDDEWPPAVQASPQPYDLWSQADMGERWPEPVTPLVWSMWRAMVDENMVVPYRDLNLSYLKDIQWTKRAYGRIYLNEGAVAYVVSKEFGIPYSMVSSSMGSPETEALGQYGWRWGTVLRRAPLMIKQQFQWERNLKKFEADFPLINRWVDEFLERDLSGVSDAELWRECQSVWLRRVVQYMEYHNNSTSMSMMAYGQLEGMAEKWLGGKETAQTLVVGLTGVIAAEIVPSLWKMARKIDELGLKDVLLQNEPKTALSWLQQHAEAQPVMEMLTEFLQRHGHRCMSEAEWLYPRWIEAPEQVIQSLSDYLRMDVRFDPVETEARQRQKREAMTAEIENKLDPLRRAYFRWGLKRTHRLMRTRDNGQHYLVKLLLPIRRIFVTLGQRWVERDWIQHPDDFFFLAMEEIESVVMSGESAATRLELKEIVAARRQAWRYWFDKPFPEVLDSAGQPVAMQAADGQMDGVLSGVAASGGRVTGKARVILAPEDAGQLQPGEILVTRATDPGWTPVLSIVDGLVLEVGGLLSHGAIVAREYGLPAVVNVPEATRRIRDGQTVTVDGSAGRVQLHDVE